MVPEAVARGIPNPKHDSFAKRLRRARKAAGMSCAGLSRLAGLGQYTVAAIESGDRLSRLPATEKLARALGLSPGFLAYGMTSNAVDSTELGSAGLKERARQVREALGLSIRSVARAAVVIEGTIRSIERGGQPTLDTLEQLAVALGVSPAWLAFGEGPLSMPVRSKPQYASAPKAVGEKDAQASRC